MTAKPYTTYIFIFFALILIGFNHLIANDGPPKGKIKGTIVSEQSNEPLEYATVALFNAANDSLITGTVSDYLGHFKIDQTYQGQYYAVITYIGFENKRSEVFRVTNEFDNINLGNLALKSIANELGEVEIVSKTAPVEYKIDKKVINVDKQITAAGGSAINVLENIPSVQVDVEGNVSLRGSSGFTVLIDGKPSILEASDALRQIPASSIENIEIITNPSAKYEPDGATGIINVITKKNYLDGLSGIVNVDIGNYEQYGGDLQLNYRLNKFNFIFGANYRQRTRPGTESSERKTYSNDTTYYVNSEGDAERSYDGKTIRAGIEYNATKNDYFSLSGRFGDWGMLHENSLRYENYYQPGTSDYQYNSLSQATRGGNYFSTDFVYQHDFKSVDSLGSKKKAIGSSQKSVLHNIKLEASYQHRYNDEITINELSTLTGSITSGRKSIESGPMNRLRLNLDYVLPLGENSKVEAGLQTRFNRSTDSTALYDLNVPGNDYVVDENYSNFTEYSRNIFAVYGLYGGMSGNWGYQAGLRGEYTYRIISTNGQEDALIDRWDYFPTLHLSYNLPFEQQLMASYSRRIDRPRGYFLEPFITWVDEYNVRQGNPELKPEYIDSYDLSYLKNFNNNFFSLESYYRITHNKIERVRSVYSEDVMLSTVDNVGNDYSLGMEAMLNIGLFSWWDMNVSGNYYYYKIAGSLNEQDFNRTSNNWNSRLNNTFYIKKNAQFQINSRYNSKTVSAQGTQSAYYSLDAALKLSFLQKRLAVNMQLRDILGTSTREYTSSGTDFDQYGIYEPRFPVFIVTLSYRFNNFKPSPKTPSQVEGGDEL